MRHQLLATVSCLALTSAASAADLPARMPVKAMPAPAIVQLWAGPYIGINGGAVWHRQESDTYAASGTVPYALDRKVTATGGLVGGQVGYNWQSQNVVFGLEADGWSASAVSNCAGCQFAHLHHQAQLAFCGACDLAGRTLFFATGGGGWRRQGSTALLR
jgi:outer membrane immunogenic protein